MTERQARNIFLKYNPPSDVTRCPNGRTAARTLLDTYAYAAANLYGIIPTSELIDIYNRQNADQTSADELYSLLLPLVIKRKRYCFYKDCIVHKEVMGDFDFAKHLLGEQDGKPRYIPEKDELIKYGDKYYESEPQTAHWNNLLDFIGSTWADNRLWYRFYNEIRGAAVGVADVGEISGLLEACGLVFGDDEQEKVFFVLLSEAYNNTRLWSNKGHSPKELREI